MAFTLTFEFKVIQSPWLVCLLSAKFLVQWYLIDIWAGWLQTDVTLSQGIGVCFMLLLAYLTYFSRRKFMLALSLYREKIEEYYTNLAHLVDTLFTGVIVLEENLSLQLANSRAKTLLQCSDTNLVESFSLIELDQRGGDQVERLCTIEEAIELYRSSGLNAPKELGIITFNNITLDLSLSRIPWGSRSAFVLLLTDISSSLELETTQTENQLKTKFLQFLPHELHTPTVGILGNAEQGLALQRQGKNEDLGKHLEIILQSAKLLHTLIGSVLDYTELISGVFELHESPTDIHDLVQEAYAAFKHQLSRQSLSFSMRIDPAMPQSIITDRKRLLQVLVTLMTNAVKYTYKGGIEIIVLLLQEGLVRFEVTDTGIGINSVKLECIQEQLRQPKGGHTIFGLELVNQLVQRLGGNSLKISSVKGTSMKFLIKYSECEPFPCADSSASSLVGLDEGSLHLDIPCFELSGHLSQILVVDDVETNRAVLACLFEGQGIGIVEAKNGVEAVEAVKAYDTLNSPLRVVIMDIEMPIMNGWEATRTIFDMFQKQDISERPYIIGYSAYSTPENFEKANKMGMITYIVKPAKATELVSIVKTLLSREALFC